MCTILYQPTTTAGCKEKVPQRKRPLSNTTNIPPVKKRGIHAKCLLCSIIGLLALSHKNAQVPKSPPTSGNNLLK